MIVYSLFLVLEVLFVLSGIVIGYRRGTGRSLVRFIELAVIAVGSLFLGRFLAAKATTSVMEVILTQYADSLRQYSATANLEHLIAGLIGALLVPVFFALIFGILKLVTLIGFKSFSGRLVHATTGKVNLEKGSKWGGAGIGLVSGVLVASIILSPVFSYLYIAGSLSDDAKETLANVFAGEEDASLACTTDKTLLHSGAKILLLDVSDLIPDSIPNFPINEFVSRIATKAEGLNSEFSANDAMPELINMATDVYATYTKAVEQGESDLNALLTAATSAVTYMEGSDFLPELTSSVLNVTGEVLQSGGEILGLNLDTSDEMVQSVLSSFSEVLTNTSPENVSENMQTLLGSADDDSDNGVLGALVSIDFSKGSELFTDDAAANALADALLSLAGNPNMSSVMENVRKIGADLIKQSGVDLFGENAEVAYAGICDGIEQLVGDTAANKDDFKACVEAASALLRNTASEAGVDDAITAGQYRLVSICLVQFVCTEENYAAVEAGNFEFTVDDIKFFFGAN